jgi:hypothetical protein
MSISPTCFSFGRRNRNSDGSNALSKVSKFTWGSLPLSPWACTIEDPLPTPSNVMTGHRLKLTPSQKFPSEAELVLKCLWQFIFFFFFYKLSVWLVITGCWLQIISCLPKQSKLRGTNDAILFKKKSHWNFLQWQETIIIPDL